MTILMDESFRVLTLVESRSITPFMQRLRFTGSELHRFDTLENLHVRLHFAKPGNGPQDTQPLNADSFHVRYYTIRAIDADSGWIDVDFVMHDDAGPGCSFARSARPGAICGMTGPCGLGIKPAKQYLFAGDETALPAIARICENLPPGATGQVFLRSENVGYDMPVPSGIGISWLPRSTVSPSIFVDHVCDAAMTTAASAESYFLWLGNPFSHWQDFRDKLGRLSKKSCLNACYWRDDATAGN